MNQPSMVIGLDRCALCGLHLTAETHSMCYLCGIAHCPAHLSKHVKAHRTAKERLLDSDARRNRTTKTGMRSVMPPDVKIDMRCHGCGGNLVQLDQTEADKLRRLESPDEAGVIAFECRTCEVVMFDDEMIRRKFIPPELRPLPTRPDSQEIVTDGHETVLTR